MSKANSNSKAVGQVLDFSRSQGLWRAHSQTIHKLGMPKNVPQIDKASYSQVYRAWLVEGLDLARSLARRIGHSQPWNLGLRRARRDTFLVRGGLPEGEFYTTVEFGFHLGGRRRLCGEGSWCSSRRAGEVDEGFAGEVEERGRRGGRERLAPDSRIIIRGGESKAAGGFGKWQEQGDL